MVLADGKPVLRDFKNWMNDQKTAKSNGKLIFREKKNEIGFPFYNRNKRKRQASKQQQQQYHHLPQEEGEEEEVGEEEENDI